MWLKAVYGNIHEIWYNNVQCRSSEDRDTKGEGYEEEDEGVENKAR